jgi:hypothetical protein
VQRLSCFALLDFSCQHRVVRRSRKILLVVVCGIVAVIVCAWLLRDALATKPIVVGLPDKTVLSFYATTHGTNQSIFPEPNPFKRLQQFARRLVRSKDPWAVSASLRSGPQFDESKTAYWWFKVNPTMPIPSGIPSWNATIHPTTDNPFAQGNFGMMVRGSGSQLIGIYLKDCPTNTPTMAINFITYKTRILAGESSDGDVITNITVPNPMFGR